MTKEKLLGLLAEGYNMNQIAAMHMISRTMLDDMLKEPVVEAPVEKKSSKKPEIAIEPMFEEEEGL